MSRRDTEFVKRAGASRDSHICLSTGEMRTGSGDLVGAVRLSAQSTQSETAGVRGPAGGRGFKRIVVKAAMHELV